ncbi:helix-turn-helix domain-containing protein [Leptospira santarosai]|uniref:helix-turn-helix domain-containing protein n=1 Tax=Leptospira santarosai TaxID=28183 RepID=UPI0024AF6C3F|nr:XRE family transcriptional regulator [Leptospira santarosai]MDI7191022.1 XRE family transcriptional regulator [Leptospira santarosai]
MNEIFQGKRITAIREARGITMRQLARQMNVTVTAVQAWETGKSQPIKEHLFNLTTNLNVPRSYFYKPLKQDGYIASNFFFRSRANARLVQKKMATRRVEWLFELLDILGEYVILPNVQIFDICKGDKYDYSQLEIEQIALEARKAMGLSGSGPIENITSLCESSGIVVSQFMISNSLDAFSLIANVSNENRPLILVDTIKDSPGRLRFSIAHELGHLFLHRNLPNNIVLSNLHREIERQADQFAAAFLLPKDLFTERVHFHGNALEDLIQLKREWRVSIMAIIHRMTDLNIIKTDYARRLYQRLSYQGYRKKEPGDDFIPFEEPSLFNLVFSMMEESGINPVELIRERMTIPGTDIDDLIGKKIFAESNLESSQGKVVSINFLKEAKEE